MSGWQPISTIPNNELVLILLAERNFDTYNWVVVDKFNGEFFDDLADFIINDENNNAMAVAWKPVNRHLSRKHINHLVGDNRNIGRREEGQFMSRLETCP